jgi:hypothetical protein
VFGLRAPKRLERSVLRAIVDEHQLEPVSGKLRTERQQARERVRDVQLIEINRNDYREHFLALHTTAPALTKYEVTAAITRS